MRTCASARCRQREIMPGGVRRRRRGRRRQCDDDVAGTSTTAEGEEEGEGAALASSTGSVNGGEHETVDRAAQDCPICFDAIAESARVCLVPCSHVLCQPCFHAWTARSDKCCLCRSPIESLHAGDGGDNCGGSAIVRRSFLQRSLSCVWHFLQYLYVELSEHVPWVILVADDDNDDEAAAMPSSSSGGGGGGGGGSTGRSSRSGSASSRSSGISTSSTSDASSTSGPDTPPLALPQQAPAAHQSGRHMSSHDYAILLASLQTIIDELGDG